MYYSEQDSIARRREKLRDHVGKLKTTLEVETIATVGGKPGYYGGKLKQWIRVEEVDTEG